MNELAINIEYLLLKHDYVIVPGLGIFRAKYTPARWIANENLFLPPVRNIHFDSSIISDPDNVFLHSLSEIYNHTEEQAKLLCEEMVSDFHKALVTEGTIDFGAIGVFTLEDDALITMSTCECGVTTPEFYGLDSFHISQLDNKFDSTSYITIESKSKSHKQKDKLSNGQENSRLHTVNLLEETKENHITLKIRRSFVKYSVAIASAIILFFIVSPNHVMDSKHTGISLSQMPMFLQPNMINEPEDAINYFYEETFTVAENNENHFTDEIVSEDIISNSDNLIETSANEDSKRAETQQKESTAEVSITPNAKFGIVLASSVSRNGAEQFIEKLAKEHNIKAFIHEKDNKRRVIITGFNNDNEARSYLNSLKEKDSQFSAAWILEL